MAEIDYGGMAGPAVDQGAPAPATPTPAPAIDYGGMAGPPVADQPAAAAAAGETGFWPWLERKLEVAGGGALRGMMTPATIVPSDQAMREQQAAPPPPAQGGWEGWKQALGTAETVAPAGLPSRVSSPFLDVTAPRTEGEKALANVASAVTGSVPYMIGAGPAGALRTGVQAVGAGLGSTVGAELFPSHPILGSLGGALIGGTAGGTATNVGGRVATAAAPGLVPPATTPVSEAMTASNITPRLAGDVTQGPLLQRTQQVVGGMPGGAAVPEAVERTGAEFNDQVNRTAALLTPGSPPPQTVQQAGEAVQREAQNWLKNATDKENQAWNGVRFGDTPVDMSRPLQVLQEASTMMPGAPKLAALETPAYFQQRLEALRDDLGSGTTLPWDTAKYWRSQIGDALGSATLGGADANKAQIKRLYGALTQAMDDTAAGQSPAAAAAYANAKAITTEKHDYIDNVLSRVINPDNPMAKQPGPVANSLLTGGRTGDALLSQIRYGTPGGQLGGMPDAADALAAYKLRELAAPIPSRRVPGRDVASTESFLTGLHPERLSPEARETLFGANPQVTSNVNNLETVAAAMRRSAQFLPNPSGTASRSSYAGLLSALATEAAGGYYATGRPLAALAGPALHVGVPFGLAQILARPAGTRFLLGPQSAPTTSPFLAGGLASYLGRPGGP